MKDSIWFTYKARIQAHKRLEWLDLHSQALLVWYAILSTILSVLTIRYQTILGKDTDMLATVLSVALLGISLSVTNRDFRGRAISMRNNYLGMQKLYVGINQNPHLSQAEIDAYSQLLGESENHKGIDDILSRVFASGLTSRKPSKKEIFTCWIWLTSRAVVTIALYVAPIVIAYGYLKCQR